MFAKLIIILALFLIVGVLISGLILLVRDKGKTDRTVKALSWRIGLSLSLFVFLFFALKLHWIAPHDLSYNS